MISYSIVIVNWNSGKQLKKCLKSINELNKINFVIDRVIVVDNNSNDYSCKISEEYEYELHIIKNKTNMGFAFACNQGAKDCISDYIIFLNPDTVMFNDTISNLSNFIVKSMGKYKIIGIQLVDEKGNISRTCSRFPLNRREFFKAIGLTRIIPNIGCLMSEWDHKSSRIVEQVIGAFFVVKTDVYKKLKGFDEQFFMYYEEVDFCKRATLKGIHSFYFVGAKAYHKGGGTSEQVIDKRLFYILQSYLKYEKKHYGMLFMLIALIIECLEYFTRLTLLVLSGQSKNIKMLNSSYKMLFKNLKFLF